MKKSTVGALRVLHLAYEDHRKPGAGGGSVRSREINERLAGAFEITVVCARYAGAKARTENGVKYRFAGVRLGGFGSILTYFLALPFVVLRYRSDLVVEDFGAPFSTIGIPWFTRRPVIGVVQWLFAREKSKQYRLPFHLVESVGLSAHRELVAVSRGLADQLAVRAPRARVQVIENGLVRVSRPAQRSGENVVLFLGRIEIAQKGVDLLLNAFASIHQTIPQTLVIAGDGPDRAAMERLAEDLGLSSRVRFLGWVPMEDRLDRMASADFLVVPSRYETFGMVAAEALSVGTPVVAFDIACLRDLVTNDNGVLVPAFDVADLGQQMQRLALNDRIRNELGRRGPGSVAHLSWDRLAEAQAEVYRRVIERHRAQSVSLGVKSAGNDELPGELTSSAVRAPGECSTW